MKQLTMMMALTFIVMLPLICSAFISNGHKIKVTSNKWQKVDKQIKSILSRTENLHRLTVKKAKID